MKFTPATRKLIAFAIVSTAMLLSAYNGSLDWMGLAI